MPILREELQSVYRRLLRAASYLPDSFARAYYRHDITSRLRSALNKAKSNGNEQSVHRDHIRKRLADARKSIGFLQRAGEGSMSDLRKVLLHTYGRSGKRRRQLIRSLIATEEEGLPQNDTALQELINNPELRVPHQLPKDSKVFAFMRSQRDHYPTEPARRRRLQHLKAFIPKENIWGRPTPVKVQANLQAKWWADTLDKLHPPLPPHEWERLRDFATGEIPLEKPPLPRSRVSHEYRGVGDGADLLKWFKDPAKVEHAGLKDVQLCETGLFVTKVRREFVRTRSFDIAKRRNRSLRRLYAGIWNLSSTMIRDEQSGKWVTLWGEGKSQHLSGLIAETCGTDAELFEGIELLPEPKNKK